MAGEDESTDCENETVEPTGSQWRAFELDVAELIRRLDPEALVEHDVSVPGHVSGTPRQVDVLVTGSLGGDPVVLAVECKRYARRLGIGKVDEFAGKLVDLGVDRGALYALNGFTAAAYDRALGARQPAIVLRALPDAGEVSPPWTEGLREFTGFGDCPNDNCYTGDVTWRDWPQDDGWDLRAGSCDTCGTWAVKCPECEAVTGFFWEEVPCQGCDLVFEKVPDRKGGDVDDVVVVRSGG